MTLSSEVKEHLERTIRSDRVVLFMKGSRMQPQCGFSAAVVGILDSMVPDYTTVNVLEDSRIRDGIKELSNWPTIPQLYVDAEFMGGCDIVKQLFNTGELHSALGVAAPDRTPPEIELSDAAAQAMKSALEGRPELAVHLSIDAKWNHEFKLAPAQGHELRARANGVDILLDLGSAPRAKGLKVDMAETLQGRGFSIDNPNAPPPVIQLRASELKDLLDSGETVHLFDARDPEERGKARIEGARALDSAAVEAIEALPKDAAIVFHCHYGPRSQAVADHFRLKGYTRVHNLLGGIDAWSQDVDPQVPRY